jgi:hypothetical protein
MRMGAAQWWQLESTSTSACSNSWKAIASHAQLAKYDWPLAATRNGVAIAE